jgi:hypothetical protein
MEDLKSVVTISNRRCGVGGGDDGDDPVNSWMDRQT